MKTKVEEIMSKEVVTVEESDSLPDVISVFNEKKISGTPVIDKRSGEVVGVISEMDVLKVFEDFQWYSPLFKAMDILHLHDETLLDVEADIKRASEMKVGDIMSKNPKTIKPDDYIDDAVMIMRSTGFNRLPVVDEEGKLKGIVTRSDILASLYDI
ncbi:MAG: CBS domain-containing protein [Halobacteriota archaeon]|nr:CBS domain-containing protein [Halobacteriota archaeon]